MTALGVVFGDIGTSPLYTVKECFSEFTGLKPVPEDVLGILSLITWALIVVVTLKYVLVVMRADNRGEGWRARPDGAGVASCRDVASSPQPLPHAGHGRRRTVLWRLPSDARDLGAERRRGASRSPRPPSIRSSSRWRWASLTILFAVQHYGNRGRRPLVRADHADLVRDALHPGHRPDPAQAGGPRGLLAADRDRVRDPARLHRLHRLGRRHPWPSPARRRFTPTWAISGRSRFGLPG